MTAVEMTTAAAVADWEAFREEVQRRLFASMDDHIGRLAWDVARLEEFQRERLRAVLATAIERSPFHRRRLAGSGIDPATFEIGQLVAPPTMTKEAMMAEFDDVATDRRVTLAAAERAIGATTSVPRPIAGELVVLASGGSSGRRGLFVFDAEGFAEYTATLLRPMIARLRSIGGPPPGGLRGAIVAADSAIHATGVASVLLDGSPITLAPVPVTLPLGGSPTSSAPVAFRSTRRRSPLAARRCATTSAATSPTPSAFRWPTHTVRARGSSARADRASGRSRSPPTAASSSPSTTTTGRYRRERRRAEFSSRTCSTTCSR
jgi:hypothetical protein